MSTSGFARVYTLLDHSRNELAGRLKRLNASKMELAFPIKRTRSLFQGFQRFGSLRRSLRMRSTDDAVAKRGKRNVFLSF